MAAGLECPAMGGWRGWKIAWIFPTGLDAAGGGGEGGVMEFRIANGEFRIANVEWGISNWESGRESESD
jgi:hypothetical protein